MIFQKIMVAIPCHGQVEPQCVGSLFAVAAQCRRWAELDVRFIRGYSCAQARNEAVRQFLESDSVYLWFVDSDITMAPETLQNLLLANCDIISGIYYRKEPAADRTAEVCRLDGESTVFYRESEIPGGIFEISGCGGGCLLIRREVIERCHSSVDGGRIFNYSFEPLISEDLWFCNVARALGYKIAAHGGVRLGHLGLVNF